MSSVNLQVNLGGLIMKNPVTVASGTFGYGAEYNEYFDVSRLGAVTVKSLTLKPRAGNKPPRVFETPAGDFPGQRRLHVKTPRPRAPVA